MKRWEKEREKESVKLEEKIRLERSALARVRLTLTNEHVITSLNHASEYVAKVKNKKERERETNGCGLSEYTMRICYRAN